MSVLVCRDERAKILQRGHFCNNIIFQIYKDCFFFVFNRHISLYSPYQSQWVCLNWTTLILLFFSYSHLNPLHCLIIRYLSGLYQSQWVCLNWTILIQYNLNGPNIDGSFTVDDSNSFFSPYKILPIAQENKYLGIFSYFITKLYVVCTH